MKGSLLMSIVGGFFFIYGAFVNDLEALIIGSTLLILEGQKVRG